MKRVQAEHRFKANAFDLLAVAGATCVVHVLGERKSSPQNVQIGGEDSFGVEEMESTKSSACGSFASRQTCASASSLIFDSNAPFVGAVKALFGCLIRYIIPLRCRWMRTAFPMSSHARASSSGTSTDSGWTTSRPVVVSKPKPI